MSHSTLEVLKQRFSPFRHRAFSEFFLVQFLSLTGNWMQDLAKSWIVINLMGKSSAMAALLFAAAIPNVILGTFGGVLADRRNIREILMFTQVALAVLAFALGIVVTGGHVEMWHLVLFALMEGIILAFDMPAFHKIVPTMVPQSDLQQALALQSVTFHLSRVIGPTLAGLAMGFWGPGSVFWINAVSFLGVLAIVYKMKIPSLKTHGQDGAGTKKGGGVREAITFVKKDPLLSGIFLQFAILMSLMFPLVFTTLRVYMQHRFNLDSKQYGLAFAFPGFGALAGSAAFLLWSPKNPVKALPFGVVGLTLFLGLMDLAPTLNLTLICLACFSFSMFLSIASLTVTIQLRVPNEIRGRVSALIGMFFVSVAPIMSVPIGLASDTLGEKQTMWGAGILFFGLSLILALRDRFRAIKLIDKIHH